MDKGWALVLYHGRWRPDIRMSFIGPATLCLGIYTFPRNARGSSHMNFLVKSQKWAIKCIRDGNRLEEHISKFEQGGRYHKWIASGEIQEYILLDFRKSPRQKISKRKARKSQHPKKINKGVPSSVLSF
jgi:hypothetical protein